MADRFFSALGHCIAFEERGTGERACLLVHGLAGDRALLVEALDAALEAAGVRRLHVDLPGHGRSTGNRDAASADALVEALGLLLVEHGGPRPLLACYSYGCYLALGLLRDVPCGGALLVCPVVEPDFGKRTRPPRRVVRRDPGLLFLPGDDDHERLTFEEVAVVQSASVLAAYRRSCMPASRAADRPFLDAVRARYVMARPYMDSLTGFDQPVTIVCGRDDHWAGFEDALRLARVLPAASYHALDGGGHLLPIEQPARLRALADDWLARVAATAKPTGASTPESSA